ncbi:MAG: DUF4934 domain-containing protein [Bacteroidales bacterium]|nr:DUF4934 domain-containing protein [Bacteroidales bacterium]
MGRNKKLKLLLTSIVLLFLFSCKNPENKEMDSKVIDIEHALQNLAHLKVSDFGKTIRYIPLETTDDGLIGRNPVVKVLKSHIVIEYSRDHCLLFNKEDGRFIAKIGHSGQDPKAFTNNFAWTDEKEEFLYFERRPNQLIRYDMKGNFCDKIKFSSSGLASCYLITDSEIIGYFDGINSFFDEINSFGQCALGIFDKEGNLKDTIPSFFPKTQVASDDIVSINIFRGNTLYDKYGNWTRAGAVIMDYKNDARQIIAANAARIWKNNETIRIKEDFIDTLYTVSAGKFIPSIAFHTGKYHWPIEEKTNKKHTNERIFIADISENNELVFFQSIMGMHSDSPVLYNGLYDKKTGETKLGKHSDGIEDDLTLFMPFSSLGMSTVGEFVSLVEAGDVMEWLENHPKAINNEQLSFLKELDGEMNPIVILIE